MEMPAVDHRAHYLADHQTARDISVSVGDAPGNPEQVLDAVFDFAENLIAQQRAFAKQMLRAASQGQQTLADVADSTAGPTGPPEWSAPRVPWPRQRLPGPCPRERLVANPHHGRARELTRRWRAARRRGGTGHYFAGLRGASG